MTTHRPFVIAVSQATRAWASCASMPSSTASDTWSQTLSGWPSVTDSEVRRNEREALKEVATTTANHIGPARTGREACALTARWPRTSFSCRCAGGDPLVPDLAAEPAARRYRPAPDRSAGLRDDGRR